MARGPKKIMWKIMHKTIWGDGCLSGWSNWYGNSGA